MRRVCLGFGLGILLTLALGGAELVVGAVPPPLSLAAARGGLVSGGAWESGSLTGRMHVLFYVDPDEKDLNEHVAEAIQRENFPSERFGSVAVINMAASAIPNFVLNRIVAGKQKKFPRTTYVRDLGKALVQHWGLADQSYDIVVLDEGGRVLMLRHGRLPEADVEKLVGLLREGVARLAGK